jgi:hypothetical protein
MLINKMREDILNSIIQLIKKDNNACIDIQTKQLLFESSKYSSTKDNIWHIYINDIKLKKTSDYIIKYKCIQCKTINTVATTQFIRKIRKCTTGCSTCNIVKLNSDLINKKEKPEKIILSLKEKHIVSIDEFNRYPELFTNTYLLSHLTEEDYNRIKKNIISYSNGNKKDIDDYEFWSIYKVNNQMNFSSVLYDAKNNAIFKADQPILKCDNCENHWRAKSIEQFKNSYKILCANCKLCNKTFKIRPTTNLNNERIIYQSKLELKFIEWCKSENLIVKNGPYIDYTFNSVNKKYRVDFQIDDILIEIKDFHIWHKNQVDSGQWKAKVDAANKYIDEKKLKKYVFITPHNWKQEIKQLTNLLKQN